MRVQQVIEAAATAPARLGARDSRRLAAHVSHCTACRRAAVEAGVDPALLVRVPLRRRLAARVAGLLPLPGFARLGRGGDAPIAAGNGGGSRWVAELPAIADSVGSGGWGKLATMATVVVAGIGASGVGTHDGSGTAAQERDDRRAAQGAAPAPARAAPGGRMGTAREDGRGGGSERRDPPDDRARTSARRGGAATPRGRATPTESTTASPQAGAPPPDAAAPPPPGAAPDLPVPAPRGTPQVPKVDVPATIDPAEAAAPVTGTVEQTVPPVVDQVEETVGDVGDAVGDGTGALPEPPPAPVPGAPPDLLP